MNNTKTESKDPHVPKRLVETLKRIDEDSAIEKSKRQFDKAPEAELINPSPCKPRSIKTTKRSVDEMYALARGTPPFITMQRCTYDELEKNHNAGIEALLKDNFPAFMNVDIRDIVFWVGTETVEFRLVGRRTFYPAKK